MAHRPRPSSSSLQTRSPRYSSRVLSLRSELQTGCCLCCCTEFGLLSLLPLLGFLSSPTRPQQTSQTRESSRCGLHTPWEVPQPRLRPIHLPPDWLRFLCFLCLLPREIVIVAYYGKGIFTIAVSDGAQCLCFDLGSSQSQASERNHLSRMGGAEPDRYGDLLQQKLMGISRGGDVKLIDCVQESH